jgi:hypothetical protein
MEMIMAVEMDELTEYEKEKQRFVREHWTGFISFPEWKSKKDKKLAAGHDPKIQPKVPRHENEYKPEYKPNEYKPNTAVKNDHGKPQFDLLPWDALTVIQRVLQFGANNPNYGPRNWEKGFNWLRPWNAAMRHLTDWERGKNIDDGQGGTGELILANAACEILFLLSHQLRNIGTDDRK